MKANNNTLHCPYCGKRAVLRSADYVYGENAVVSHLYVCSGYPECDSFVGVHKDTLLPLGYPANGELRRKRIEAHRMFDLLWKKVCFQELKLTNGFRISFALPGHMHISAISANTCATSLLKNHRKRWKTTGLRLEPVVMYESRW